MAKKKFDKMWNVRKVKQIIAQDHTQLNIVGCWVNEVRKNLKTAEQLSKSGEDRLAIISTDDAYNEVPANILNEVKHQIMLDFAYKHGLKKKIDSGTIMLDSKVESKHQPL
jgi:hypothetical protein